MKLKTPREWLSAVYWWAFLPGWWIRTKNHSRWWDAKYISALKHEHPRSP